MGIILQFLWRLIPLVHLHRENALTHDPRVVCPDSEFLTHVTAFPEIDGGRMVHVAFLREGVPGDDFVVALRDAAQDAPEIVG